MIIQADATRIPLADESVNCCVTSPPYWGLRDYGVAGQLGLEPTPELYVEKMVAVFRGVRRVLRNDGTLWMNLGDSYSGSGKGGNPDEGKQATNKGSQTIGVLYGKTADTARQAALTNVSQRWTTEQGIPPKNLVGIPWRVAFALQADGWYLRQDIIWHKPNPMPESVTDRCTKAHEYIFLLSKSERYYYDAAAVRETAEYGRCGWASQQFKGGDITRHHGGPGSHMQGCDPSAGRNRRSVWTVPTYAYAEAHFATFPPKLIEPCIKAGCPEGGIVLDPFGGSGTTAEVALKFGRRAVLLELNPEYIKLATRRMNKTLDGQALFAGI